MAAAASPFGFPVFRALWIATVVSNVGTWMQSVGAAWLMTSLSPSPFMVALVQAATTLPMFLLALPAGALADIVDRRLLLIATQLLGLLASAALAVFVWLGIVSPAILLGATLALGISAALSSPAFQAITPELVDRAALPDAIALNGLGVNVSRAIGPALGGLLVAAAGTAAVFALNAISTVAVLFVLWRWRRAVPAGLLPPEHFLGALRAGWRYARHAPPLQLVAVRAIGFFLFSSALLALLPLVARDELRLGAAGYGALLGWMGAGAVLGAVALRRLRRRLSDNVLSAAGTALFSLSVAAAALAPGMIAAGAAMLVAGAAWILVLTTFNVVVQTATPDWVRARALALYLLVFQGAMTAGSLIWGAVAARAGVADALLIAAAGQAATLPLALLFRLPKSGAADLAPSRHWAEPVLSLPVADDRGPVLVEVEYRVAPEHRAEFLAALRRFRNVRLRDGALRWDLWEDTARPGLFIEAFIVESWLEHERQHERVTNADRADQDLLNGFQRDGKPRVRHFLRPG